MPELRAILAHNRDEEIEHASMTLEWIRRREPGVRQAVAPGAVQDGPDHRPALRMHAMGAITRDSLMSLEAYAKARRDVSRARARAQEAAHRASGRARDAALRGRAHDPLPDPGDAPDREGLRGRGHPGRARRLQSARARRLEPQGDDADRVRGRRRAQGARSRGSRASRTASGSTSTDAPASPRSPTRTCRAPTPRRPPRSISCASSSTREMVAALKRGARLGDRRRSPRLQGSDSGGRRGDARVARRRSRLTAARRRQGSACGSCARGSRASASRKGGRRRLASPEARRVRTRTRAQSRKLPN